MRTQQEIAAVIQVCSAKSLDAATTDKEREYFSGAGDALSWAAGFDEEPAWAEEPAASDRKPPGEQFTDTGDGSP